MKHEKRANLRDCLCKIINFAPDKELPRHHDKEQQEDSPAIEMKVGYLRIGRLTGSDGKMRIVRGEEAEIIGADEEKRTDDYWGGGDAM